jgi:hypothetical protein
MKYYIPPWQQIPNTRAEIGAKAGFQPPYEAHFAIRRMRVEAERLERFAVRRMVAVLWALQDPIDTPMDTAFEIIQSRGRFYG